MTVLVIPAANSTDASTELLDNLLWSIQSQDIHKSYPVIVCFDRGSEDGFAEHFVTEYPWIEAILNHGNRLNFAKNSNQGLRRAFYEYKDHAIVVNQDTIIPAKKYLDQIHGEGVVSPQQVSYEGTKGEILSLLNKDNAAQPYPTERQSHLKLVGFFLFINYKVMEKVGFWDERYITFEDDSYCVRTALAGFPCETVGMRVNHAISKCGQYDGERLSLNFAKFKYMWSIPTEIEHLDCAPWIMKNHTWCDEMYHP